MRPHAVLGAVLMALVLAVRAEAASHVIEIKNMAYGPAPKNLKVGDTIEWKNNDMFRHTATARTGAFDLDIPPGGHAQATLKSAGILNIYCRYHPTMTLRLTVASAQPAQRKPTPKRRSAR
jgi:plastocyanin